MNRWLIGLWLAVMVCSAAALSEESLNDLKRLPQFQRYIQRLKKTHQTLHEQLESPAEGSGASYAAGLSTWPSSSSSTALPTWDMAALQEEQLASSSLMKVEEDASDSGQEDSRPAKITSVSEAKEKLRTRKKKKDKKRDHHQHASTEKPPFGEKEAATEARKHLRKMLKPNVKCGQPSARLTDVRQYHRDKSDLIFFPRCTWLHRCSDEIGCCFDAAKTCSPLRTEIVSLYFYAQSIRSEEKFVIKLDFDNHTQCGCIDRNSDLMPRTEEVILGPRNRYYGNQWTLGTFRSSSSDQSTDRSKSRRDRIGARTHLNTDGADYSSARHQQCKCPSEYTQTIDQTDGTCLCDCKSRPKSNHCFRLKRGLETFFLRDRGCISDGQCRIPLCEFGRYIVTLGRCPKREEQDAVWLKWVA